jgi:hypothetical protein
MIYLASPYSALTRGNQQKTRAHRFSAVCLIAARLIERGEMVFSPIAHSHPIALRCKLPTDAGYWGTHNRAWLSACSVLVVAMMPGWETSKGIAAEIQIAHELGLPVRYMDPKTLEYVEVVGV